MAMPKRAPKHIGFAAAVEKARAGGARNPAAAIASAARNPALSKVGGVGKRGRRGAGEKG